MLQLRSDHPQPEARADRFPVAIRESPDQPDLPLRESNRKQSEVRNSVKPFSLPIEQLAIGRSHRVRSLRRDEADHYVWPMPMIFLCGEHYSGTHLSQLIAWKRADDHVTGSYRASSS